MSAEFTQRSRDDRRTIVVDVADAEVRKQPYSSAGRQYRPVLLTIVYTEKNQSGWNLQSVEARGPVLKKDGTDSLNEATENFWSHDGYPDFVQAAVKHFHPHAKRADQ